MLHPTGPVAAALLGLARQRPVGGEDFILALLVGMEIECRVGLVFTAAGSGGKQGWYSTGIAGGIGAAAALGKVLSFDEAGMLNAMGLAAARACGNRGTHGSMAAQYVPALAAESGFMAAHLTAAGLSCGARALDGPSGLLDLLTDRPAYDRALRDLGTCSEATRTAFKPYPSGIITHPVIDACLALVRDHGVTPEQIAAVDVAVSQTALNLGAGRRPDDVLAAQISLSFWAAATLATGVAAVSHMDLAFIRDPALRRLEDKIAFFVDPALSLGQCRATARLTGGRVVEIAIAHVTGSPERPMSSAQVDAKFSALLAPSMPPDKAMRLLGCCRSVLSLADVSEILGVQDA